MLLSYSPSDLTLSWYSVASSRKPSLITPSFLPTTTILSCWPCPEHEPSLTSPWPSVAQPYTAYSAWCGVLDRTRPLIQITLFQIQAHLHAGCLGPSLKYLKSNRSKTELMIPPQRHYCLFFFPISINNTPVNQLLKPES